MVEFFFGHINGTDGGSQSLTDLYRQVAQAADAEDREPLPWLDIGVLQRAIDRDSRAEKWRSFDRGKPIRNLQGMTSGSFHEFSVAAIHGYAGDLLFNAEVLISSRQNSHSPQVQ